MLKNIKYKSCFFFIFMVFVFFTSNAQKINITPQETEQLIEKAKNKVKIYQEFLNTIGLEKNTKWYEDDIDDCINLVFESDSVSVFNNLNFNNQKAISAHNYLNAVKKYYPQGVIFSRSLQSIQEPCSITTSEYTYIYLKLTYTQTIVGFNYNFDKYQEVPDTIDIYVKFIVRQVNPLATDLDKIYKITKHKVTNCEDEQKEENNTIIEDKDLTFAKISQGNEANILREYAKVLVADYANVLNAVNNEKMNTKGLLEDYYYNDTTELYNDIIQHSDKILVFSPKDYIEQIKKYWKKDGIKFRYEIQEDNVKTAPGLGHMSVEVIVKRTIDTKNFKDKRNKFKGNIRVVVWFPVDDKGNVILKRGSGKIHKIEEKEYLPAEIREKANTYYLQAGLQINTMNYFGELNRFETITGTTPTFTRPSFGIHVSKKIKPQWYLRLSYIWGILRGDDFVSADPLNERHRYRYIRNLHFRNYIHEVSLTATYEIFRARASRFRARTYKRRNFINVYVLAGIGILKHNPQAKTPLSLGGNWVNLRDLGTEGQGIDGYRKKYSLWQASIPLGFGVKIKLTSNIDLGLEIGGRLLFTDYLDDVSGDYPAMEDLSPLARLMSNRTLETTSAITGESRVDNITRIAEIIAPNVVYTGTDGNTYETFSGFGRRGDQRGNPKTNDFYVVTGIHLNYIFGR